MDSAHYRPFFIFCINKNEITKSNRIGIDIHISILFFQQERNISEKTYLESLLNDHEHSGKKCSAKKKFVLDLGHCLCPYVVTNNEEKTNLYHYLLLIFKENELKLVNFYGKLRKNCFENDDTAESSKIYEAISYHFYQFKLGIDTDDERNIKEYCWMENGETIQTISEICIKHSLNFYYNGMNILHFACLNYPSSLIEIFLRHCDKEDVNRQCQKYGHRPLRYLLENPKTNEKIVNLIFEKGAETEYLTHADIEDTKVIKITQYDEYVENRIKFINCIKEFKYREYNQFYLPLLKKIPNWRNLLNIQDWRKSTPLHYVVINRNIEVVEFLLENGCNSNAKNFSGATPLHEAVLDDSTDIAEILLRNGANANEVGVGGDTPLHYIQNSELFHILLYYGADINKTNVQGATPLSEIDFNLVILDEEEEDRESNKFFKEFCRYLFHLKKAKKYIHPNHEWCLSTLDEEREIKYEYQIEKLKNFKIHEEKFSLFDVLYCEDFKKMYFYENVINDLKMLQCERNMLDILKKRYLLRLFNENVAKIVTLHEGIQKMLTSNSDFSKLPYLCIINLFKYLNVDESLKLMKALDYE